MKLIYLFIVTVFLIALLGGCTTIGTHDDRPGIRSCNERPYPPGCNPNPPYIPRIPPGLVPHLIPQNGYFSDYASCRIKCTPVEGHPRNGYCTVVCDEHVIITPVPLPQQIEK